MAKRKIKRIKRKEQQKKGTILAQIVAFLILCGVVFGIYATIRIGGGLVTSLNAIERTTIAETDEELLIDASVREQYAESDVINIAVFGLDTRPEDEVSRSDTIMILSVDKTNGTVKVISIMRDTYVYIPGHYYTRINTAYAIGGAELAIKTINYNFDMNITDYVTVDFAAISDVVNAMGGLTLTITEEEVYRMNETIRENNKLIEGEESDFVVAGTQLCDGNQVLAYARIRKLGNGDFDRTARQRIVVSLMMEKLKSEFSIPLVLDMASAACDNIETSLNNRQLAYLAYAVITTDAEPELISLTNDDYLKSATINGAMILLPYHLDDAAEDLHEMIWPGIPYTPSETCEEASDDLAYHTRHENIYTISTETTLD